jgi:hypothetical protein
MANGPVATSEKGVKEKGNFADTHSELFWKEKHIFTHTISYTWQ